MEGLGDRLYVCQVMVQRQLAPADMATIDPRLHVAVQDGAAGQPRLHRSVPAGPTASPRGRGLLLVNAMAAAWGAMPARGGKVVWATLM